MLFGVSFRNFFTVSPLSYTRGYTLLNSSPKSKFIGRKWHMSTSAKRQLTLRRDLQGSSDEVASGSQ